MESDQWKSVNGVEVIEVNPAKTPLFKDNGDGTDNGAYYVKAVEMLLANGEKTFGCTWPDCTFTYGNPTTIASGHWKSHEVTPDLRRVPFKDWTLEQILGRLQDSESDLKLVMAQRDKAIQRQGNRELVAELRQELKDTKAELAKYKKASVAFGKLFGGAQ